MTSRVPCPCPVCHEHSRQVPLMIDWYGSSIFLVCSDCGTTFETDAVSEPHPLLTEPFFMMLNEDEIPCSECGMPECVCPVEVRCEAEYALVMAAETLGEMMDLVKEHRKTCATCAGIVRKPIGRQERDKDQKRGVA